MSGMSHDVTGMSGMFHYVTAMSGMANDAKGRQRNMLHHSDIVMTPQ